MRETLAEPHVN